MSHLNIKIYFHNNLSRHVGCDNFDIFPTDAHAVENKSLIYSGILIHLHSEGSQSSKVEEFKD